MRLFIAFETDEALKRELARAQRSLRKASSRHISFVAEEHLHITLKFLGEVEEEKLEALKTAVASMASKMKPLVLKLGQVSCNPPHGALKLVWVLPTEESGAAELKRNFDTCNQALEGLVEFPEKENRPYLCHLTLARVHRDNREQKAIREAAEKFSLEPLEIRLDSLTLFKSMLTHQGARHEALLTCRLGETA